MTEIKSCVSCAHYQSYFNSSGYCYKFTYEKVDYINGKVEINPYCCEELRKPKAECGPSAVGWEQKPYEKPKSKIRKFLDAVTLLVNF